MDLITSTQPRTMTSREIADLVCTSHDSVLKTVRALIERGVVSGNETPYTHPQNGQTYAEFHLNYRDTMVIASGYSVELRAKVIDRWQELEGQAAHRETFVVPQTYAQALLEAGRLAVMVEQQQAQIEQARPAVEFVGRYVQAEGLKGFREVCKLLKANETDFRIFLMDRKVMYRLAGKLMAYQPHIDAGRFAIKAGIARTNEHAYNDCRFTPKGIEWIAGEWAKYLLREAAEV